MPKSKAERVLNWTHAEMGAAAQLARTVEAFVLEKFRSAGFDPLPQAP